MRKVGLLTVAAVLLAGPTVLAFFSGGFFEKPRLIAGVGAWTMAAIAAMFSSRPLPRQPWPRATLAGLVLLAAWVALSYEWAPIGSQAQGDIQRLVLYVGFFLAVFAVAGTAFVRTWSEVVLAAGAFVVAAYGLSARLLPSIVQLEQSRSGEGRLEQPLTYWNAMGCLCAIGLVLSARIAADSRRPAPVRAAGAFMAVWLGLATYLSFSRGALLALAVGLVSLALLAPSARGQVRAVLTVAGSSLVTIVVASFFDRVTSLSFGVRGDPGDGLVVLAVLLVMSSAAAVVTLRTTPEPEVERRARRVAKPAVAVALVVVAATGILVTAALETSPSDRSTREATSATRFGSVDSLRYSYWEVAFDEFVEDPVKGRGTGGFAVDWRRQPDRPESAVDAHSLYVETLGELGLVGAAFLGLFIAGIATCGGRLYVREPALAAGPLAALLTYLVHAGVDWDWEMPALTGLALALAASVVAWEDQPTTAVSSPSDA